MFWKFHHFAKKSSTRKILIFMDYTGRKPSRKISYGVSAPFSSVTCCLLVTTWVSRRVSWWEMRGCQLFISGHFRQIISRCHELKCYFLRLGTIFWGNLTLWMPIVCIGLLHSPSKSGWLATSSMKQLMSHMFAVVVVVVLANSLPCRKRSSPVYVLGHNEVIYVSLN